MERDTRQRRAIREALISEDRPLSPAELLEAAKERVPEIGQATVYRNIRTLGAEGLLDTVDLPGRPSRYELSGKEHHHHFVCRGCDSVYDVADCPGDLRPLTPSGFRLEGHEVVLYGLCASCA